MAVFLCIMPVNVVFIRDAPCVADAGHSVKGGGLATIPIGAGHKLDATRPCEKALDGSY